MHVQYIVNKHLLAFTIELFLFYYNNTFFNKIKFSHGQLLIDSSKKTLQLCTYPAENF